MKKILMHAAIVVSCLMYAIDAQCQTLPKSISDELREVLLDLRDFTETDSARYIDLVDEAVAMARKEHNDTAVWISYFDKITYLSFIISPESAMPALEELQQIVEKNGAGESWVYDSWNNLVVQYINSNRMIEGVTEVNRMLDYATKKNNNYGIAMTYTMLGNLNADSYDVAMKNYANALQYMEKSGNMERVAYVYMLMAHLAAKHEKYEEVLRFTSTMRKVDKYGRNSQFADILDLQAASNLGYRPEAKGSYDQLMQQWSNGEIAVMDTDDFLIAVVTYLCKFDNPEKALPLIAQLPIDDDENRLKAMLIYYDAKHDYKNAYETLKSISDYKEDRAAKMQEAEYANADAYYHNKVLESEKQKLELESTKKDTWNLIIMIALLATLIAVGLYFIFKVRKVNRKLREEYERTEQQRAYAESLKHRAQTTEQMKTTFINSMCHEMRTPMNAISGFATLMFNEKFSEDQRKKYATILQNNVESLTHLLENMLDMSNLITMSDELERTSVDLGKLCERTLEESRSYNSNNLELRIDVERNLKIDTNADYLGKVIKELLVNAMKFTEKGRIALCCYQDITNNKVLITVTDTGIGVEPDKREWMFGQYNKIDRFKPGVGIGLFICRQICEHLGMRIYADPNYTTGTRMVITYATN